MSELTDGIASVSSLSSQINELEKQRNGTSNSNKIDPKTVLVGLQQNFNNMLNNLITSSDDKNKSESNPLSFLTATNDTQSWVNNLTQQNTPAATNSTTDNTTASANLGLPSGNNPSLSDIQNNPQLVPYTIDINKIF